MKEPSTIQEGGFEGLHTELILRRLTLVCIAITAGISSLAIIGWALNWLLLARISPAYIPMAQSSALSFVILSFVLFAYARKLKHPFVITVAMVGAFMVLLLNLIILIDFFTGAGLDIEKILYSQPEKFDDFLIGRMSPITAAIFLLSFFALLLLLISAEGRHRAKSASSYLAFIVVSAGLVMVLGYIYGTPLLYGGTIIPVALTTAIAFVFMGTGLILAAGGHYFPVSSFVGTSLQARLMRTFVPFTIAIILINGFFDVVILQLAGNYVLALSLSAIFSLILVGIVISKIVRAIGSSIDRAEIERKQADEALSHSNERIRRFIDSNIVGVVIASPSGSIIETNDYYLRTIGYTREEFEKGMVDWRTITPPEWLPADEKAIEELREKGICTPYEKEYIRRDGTRVSVFLSDAMLPGPEEQIAAFVIDITDRKRAEYALQESKTVLRSFFDSPGVMRGIVEVVAEDDVRHIADNAVTAGFIGLTPEAMKNKLGSELGEPKELLRKWVGFYKQSLSALKPISFEYIDKRGEKEAWLSATVSYLGKGTNGDPRFAYVVSDITERKQAEEKLREKSEELERYFTNSLDLLCIADTQGYFRRLNPEWEKTLGYSLSELEGRHFLDFVHPDDLSATLSANAKLSEQRQVLNFVNRYQRKDGSYCWIEWRSYPVGNLIYAAARDITERKRMEEALHKSQAGLAAAQRLAHIGSWEWDVVANTALWSDETYQIFGIPHDPLEEHRQNFLDQIHPDDRARVDQALSDALNGKNQYDLEYRIILPDKTEKVIHALAEVFRNDQGMPLLMHGTVHEITERKRVEDELKSLSVRNEAILASVPDIIMEVDNDKVYRWANKAGIQFFGDDVIGKEADYYFEGEQKTYEMVRPLFEGFEDVIYVESWQRRKDGEKRLLAWWCRVLKDSKENTTGALSTARDITEQKQAEQALLILNEELDERVKARTSELDKKNVELQEKNAELEKFNRLFIGRELRMIELKKKIAEYETKLGISNS